MSTPHRLGDTKVLANDFGFLSDFMESEDLPGERDQLLIGCESGHHDIRWELHFL